MTRYRITLDTSLENPPGDFLEEEHVMTFLEDVLEHLEEFGGPQADADAGGQFTSGAVHIAVNVNAADPRDALEDGAKLIVRALEAAGSSLDNWWLERFIVEPEDTPQPLAINGR